MSKIKNERGFSLIELTFVVAIIGIMAAIAVPNYISSMPQRRTNMAVSDFVAQILYAKTKAVSENLNTTIIFDPSSTFYTNADSEVVPLPDGIQLGYAAGAKGIDGADITSTINVIDGIMGLSTDDRLTMSSVGNFSSVGFPNSKAYIYFIPSQDIASASKGRMRGVEIYRTTGKIQAYKYDGTTWSAL